MPISRKDEIVENLAKVQEQIANATKSAGRNIAEIKLIAVTKTFPVSDLHFLYELGIRDFGENRDQEAILKTAELPKDINWHFQGQIQSNKLKSITNWASVIHSVDQFRYAKLISEFAGGQSRGIFIQVSLDEVPESRGGVDPSKILQLANEISELRNIELLGLMAVAPLQDKPANAFSRLQRYQSALLEKMPNANSLSIGMSGDFEVAISHGATHLRIGSSILGNRQPIT